MKKVPVILIALFLPLSASAALLNPYVVDEKPQVKFGDSTYVSTYFGLENYIQDYVGGYAHITFTYTHSRCCFAGHPPRLYVTGVDPRSTTTPNVKSLQDVYTLQDIFHDYRHETDWYSYDIQFDSTGYIVVVKRAGSIDIANFHQTVPSLGDGDWVAIANLHPINGITGPGPGSLDSMSFTPMPLKSAPTRTPVIIIPGIMGSELLDNDIIGLNKLIWPDTVKIALNPTDDFLDVLKMNDDGYSIKSNIYTRDITREVSNNEYWSTLINLLTDQGFIEGVDLFVFPYDWRENILDISTDLKNKIDEIKVMYPNLKIDVISHSMGGLIFKEYLNRFSGESIDKFIDVGTPHIGSPLSFKTLQYGDDIGVRYLWGLVSLNQNRIKIISQNMPSVYQLLPSSSYGGYLYDLDDFDQNGVRGLLSYSDTKTFMKNTGRNPLLVDNADTFHREIDGLNPSDYGVKTYNIVGCGTETLDKIFIMNKEDSGGTEYNISFTNGDGTVPLRSAEAMSADRTYYLKNAKHALIPSTSGAKGLIVGILNATTTEDFDISPYSNLATNASGCTIPDGKIVSFHSPIDLHIYLGDSHVGPNAEGDIEYVIPGVSYEIIDNNKFAFLPDGVDYVIKGSATASSTFNARIQKLENESVIETQYFNSIPISNTTEVEVKPNSILVDNNGDEIVDSEVLPSAILDQAQSQDVTKPVTAVMVEGKKRDRYEPFSKPVKISFIATDDNAGVLKTEYSLNNGSVWLNYLAPFTHSTRGENKILYRSTDKAGNIEVPKSVTIICNQPGRK